MAAGHNEGTMLFDWTTGGLAEGLRCYREQRFFDAHEHWEGVWLSAPQPEKLFLQALIQITVAFHHRQRGNKIGAQRLLKAALKKLDQFPPEYGGLHVEEIRASVRAWLEALEQSAEAHILLPPIGGDFHQQPDGNPPVA